jgi:alpha-beta hydrolase superfamily lysophospholipase
MRIGSGRRVIPRRLKASGSIMSANDLQHVQRIPASTPFRQYEAMTTRFDALPSSLRARAQLDQFGPVPVLLASPEPTSDPPPLLVWLHGRTANKELDPGRYLRCIRAGIAVCAMDLPGHGDRGDVALQTPERVIDVVLQAADEIDAVVLTAIDRLGADARRVAIGGMSAGGMASIARLLRPHRFAAACLEATSGDWASLPMVSHASRPDRERIIANDPVTHLNAWRSIPVLAIHAKLDQWIPMQPQWRFLDAIAARGPSSLIERVVYDRTGAPGEHAGFGSHAADAKAAQIEFLRRHFLPENGVAQS